MCLIGSTRRSFKDSLKALEADIQHANTLYDVSTFSPEFLFFPSFKLSWRSDLYLDVLMDSKNQVMIFDLYVEFFEFFIFGDAMNVIDEWPSIICSGINLKGWIVHTISQQ